MVARFRRRWRKPRLNTSTCTCRNWNFNGVYEKGGHKLTNACLGKLHTMDGAGGCGGQAFAEDAEGQLHSEKFNFVRICEQLTAGRATVGYESAEELRALAETINLQCSPGGRFAARVARGALLR
eukprot:COSAG01_NODE_41471_length_451_cov_0.730114_1_plen_124_part_10